MSRRYTMKQRAESKDETRQRIVEATAALHEELGPRGATVSAIAGRAGVQRLTVYRHFPDENALFQACTAHWLARNPPPAPPSWSGEVGLARCRTALAALYAYYRRTARMWTVSERDEADVPALAEPMDAFRRHLDLIRDDLAAALAPPAAQAAAVRAVLGHAVRFQTWRSLAAEGLTDGAAADLVCAWLAGIAAGGSRMGAPTDAHP